VNTQNEEMTQHKDKQEKDKQEKDKQEKDKQGPDVIVSQKEIMRQILSEVTDKLTMDLRSVLSDTIERQITTALTQALLEGEFYRRVSKDMRSGLKRIYKEISTASKAGAESEGTPILSKERADKLFHEASEQLNTVLIQTKKAAEDIMEVVERHMEIQCRTAEILAQTGGKGGLTRKNFNWLCESNEQSRNDLNQVLMSLSFQDLTGQRIKHVVKALQEIESTVVELYLSTGLLIQAYEEAPHKSLDQIEQETRQTVDSLKAGPVVGSELKGPSDASQANIDALLAQLGMD